MVSAATSNVDLAAAAATIATFAVVILGAIAYFFGAVWPLKIQAVQFRGPDGKGGEATEVTATITNRGRNTKTLSSYALVKDPGRIKRRITVHADLDDIQPFQVSSVQVPNRQVTISGHDVLVVQGLYLKGALPYGTKTRVIVEVGPRHFIAKIRDISPRTNTKRPNAAPARPIPPPAAIPVSPGDRDVVMVTAGPKIFDTVKALRDLTGDGLMDVNRDVLQTNRVWLQAVDQATAEVAKARLEAVDATVEIRPSTKQVSD